MQDEFHIAMTMELESEVSELCNLSQGIFNEGVTEGMNRGLDKGIEGAVELLREAGFGDQDIIEKNYEQVSFNFGSGEEICTSSHRRLIGNSQYLIMMPARS